MVSPESPGFNAQQGPKPPGANGYRVFNGNRRVYGVDVNFNLRWKNYTSWVAYTWSKNEDQYDQIFNGNYFQSQDDRRHQIKWIHQLQVNKWMFNTNIIYSSGRPYLALEAIDDRMPRNQLNNKAVIKQLPDYIRWDVSMAYEIDIASLKSSIGVSVFNILNRRNVNYLQYAYKFESQQPGATKNLILGTESELLGRSLNLELTVEF